MKLQRVDMELFRNVLDGTIKAMAETTGYTLKAGTIRFDKDAGRFSFTVEGVVPGGLTKEGQRLMRTREDNVHMGLPEVGDWLADSTGRRMVVTGINASLTKVIADDACGKGTYLIPLAGVKRMADRAAGVRL